MDVARGSSAATPRPRAQRGIEFLPREVRADSPGGRNEGRPPSGPSGIDFLPPEIEVGHPAGNDGRGDSSRASGRDFLAPEAEAGRPGGGEDGRGGLPCEEVAGPPPGVASPDGSGDGDAEGGEEPIRRQTPTPRNRDKPITGTQAGLLVASVALPAASVFLLFSSLTLGLDIYNAMAPTAVSVTGDLLFGLAALAIALLYVLGLEDGGRAQQAAAGASLVVLVALACLFKSRKYPWGPVFFALILGPAWIFALRATVCEDTRRRDFYGVIAGSAGACALALVIFWVVGLLAADQAWGADTKSNLIQRSSPIYEHMYGTPLIYARDCGPSKSFPEGFPASQKLEISEACKAAATVWFLAWACPLIAAGFNVFLAMFCLLHLSAAVGATEDVSVIEKLLKSFIFSCSFFVVGMYASVSIAGTSLRLGSTIMAACACGIIVVVISTYQEIGEEVLRGRMGDEPLVQLLRKAWRSDVAKAFLIWSFHVLIPIYFGLNFLKTRRLRCMGLHGVGSCATESFSGRAKQIIQTSTAWNWSNILIDVCLISEVFFLFQVGVSKVTYIFLSWLNTELKGVDFGLVILLIVLIGILMFLLPPVPGLPVYLFCGVVIAEKGRQTESVGYGGGCAIAIVVAFSLKLCGCVGQYSIGFRLGKSVKVQQLIGVDTVPTRAVERIVGAPGLSAAKVAVLVGGPDWPTSVTYGILQLSLPQMLLGTCPVIVPTVPTVLAGSFMARVTTGEDSVWNMLLSVAMGLAVLSQGASMCAAFFFIAQTIEQHGAELARPRPEHEAVAELTRSEQRMNDRFAEATRWDTLGSASRGTILAAVVTQLAATFIFLFMDESSFRSFSVNDDVYTNVEDGGLGGNPLHIVKPMGAVGLVLFSIGFTLHVAYVQLMTTKANISLSEEVKMSG